MNKYLPSLFNLGLVLIASSLIGLKLYYGLGADFETTKLRAYRQEYRDLFEYELSPEALSYWKQVVTNYQALSPVRRTLLNKYLPGEEVSRLKETIPYIEILALGKRQWTPQKVKDNLIYFKHKNIYQYLHSLQAPVLSKEFSP